MVKIFLSYARADGGDAAAELRDQLEQAGFSAWQDIEEMRGGEAWKEQLREALRQVDAALVLLTPGAVESKYVTWEWETALALKKRVIPLLVRPCAVPDELRRLHYHNLSRPDSYTMGFAALVRDLVEAQAPPGERPAAPASPGGPTFHVYEAKNSAIGTHPTVINTSPAVPPEGD